MRQRRGTSARVGVGIENCSADEVCGADVRVREDGKRR